MVRCDECEALLLEYQYGLLEPGEVAIVEEHLGVCPTCPAALERARHEQRLLASAAKLPFPEVTFTPPVEATPQRKTSPAVRTARWSWVLAASLLLVLSALTFQVGRIWQDHQAQHDRTVALANRVQKAQQELDKIHKDTQEKQKKAEEQQQAAQNKHDAAVVRWVAHDLRENAGGEFSLTVSGPAAAMPGAPNEYRVEATGPGKKPIAAEIEAEVRNGDEVIFSTKLVWEPAPAPDRRIVLPARLWANLPPDAKLTLTVTAIEPKTGARATLSEPLPLQGPVLMTMLTTDKPLYRPGEPVFFRSVSLDRATHQPPRELQTLRYELINSRQDVLDSLTGKAEPQRVTTRGDFETVLGPDGQPVRGIGAGSFRLKDDLPGGEYTLRVFEVPANHPADQAPPPGTVPLATRSIVVMKYRPDVLLKSLDFDKARYGPGDEVQARVTVRDQDRPAAGVLVQPTVRVDGQAITAIQAPFQTAADGTASIRFRLPAEGMLDQATLAVGLVSGAGIQETITRPIPLTTRKLIVEFFPEGGDLIVGVPCKVYFRVTTPTGQPAELTGYLTDGQQHLGQVRTLSDDRKPGVNQGLGSFTITPEPGKRYALKVMEPFLVAEQCDPVQGGIIGGLVVAQSGLYPVPRAIANGLNLHVPHPVVHPNEPIVVRISGNDPRKLFIGAYARGVAIAAASVDYQPHAPRDITLTPDPASPGGVTRITVFEEPDPAQGRHDLVPVAERLIYRRPATELKLDLQTQRSTFAPGDEVDLTVRGTQESGQPTAALLWLSVVNESVLSLADDRSERSLPAHFLLAGEIQHPDGLEHADFILSHDPLAVQTLDLLLGTQGWRRFAEQAPTRFRSQVSPEIADRFLAAAGLVPYLPEQGTARPHPMTEEYREAAFAWDEAKARLDALRTEKITRSEAPQSELAAVAQQLQREQPSAQASANTWRRLRAQLPYLAIVLAFAGVVLVVMGRANRPARRPLQAVGGMSVVLALVLIGLACDTTEFRPEDMPSPHHSLDGETAPVPAMGEDAGDGRALVESVPVMPAPGFAAMRMVEETAPEFLTAARGVISQALEQWLASLPNRQARSVPALQLEQALHRHKLTEGGTPTAEEQQAVQRAARVLVEHHPFVVREYAHTRTQRPEGDDTRIDFTETVLWHPLLVMPGEGIVSTRFQLSDSVQSYRVLVAGHTLDGRLGSTQTSIAVRQPLTVEIKTPSALTTGDELDLPIVLMNTTDRHLNVTWDAWSDHGDISDARSTGQVQVLARQSARASVPVQVRQASVPARIRIRGRSNMGDSDAIERVISVSPRGYPVAQASSGLLKGQAEVAIRLPDALVPNTFQARVVVYSNPLAELQSSLAGMLREPHGCFEQTSSANYPNVLVLDMLKGLEGVSPTIIEDARSLLERGQQRILQFEVPVPQGDTREGFEWFGQFPPHDGLTAYGLMQLSDMARVYPVDPVLLKRTRDFLLKPRKDEQPIDRRQRFGNIPDEVLQAYILWAISESERYGPKSDINNDLSTAAKQALVSNDPYQLALVGNTLLNRQENADDALAALARLQGKNGALPTPAVTITRSRGQDAIMEATALAALAWLKHPPSLPRALRAIEYIRSARQGSGTFGATQATILALKALVEYSRLYPPGQDQGEIRVRLAGEIVATVPVSSSNPEPITVTIPADHRWQPGDNPLRIESTAVTELPYTVSWEGYIHTPTSHPDCALKIRTTLDQDSPQEGDMVSLQVDVENITAEEQGMVIASIGLPAGVIVPPAAASLRALVRNGTIAHWELQDRSLILYWRGIPAQGTLKATIQLLADVPGQFSGPASAAYLYYQPTAKCWTDPLSVRVRPAHP